MNEQIEKAANILGGQTATAKLLAECTGEKIVQGNIWSWINRTGTVPPDIAPYFEALTAKKGERISKAMLCPDFPWDMCCKENCQRESVA